MKNIVAMATPALLAAYLLTERLALPVHDFAQGLMAGLSIVGMCCLLLRYGKERRQRTTV